ncbi:MAG: hypothetical protein WCA16_15710 [Candidatus Sulfotelmatobacter sp.]
MYGIWGRLARPDEFPEAPESSARPPEKTGAPETSAPEKQKPAAPEKPESPPEPKKQIQVVEVGIADFSHP